MKWTFVKSAFTAKERTRLHHLETQYLCTAKIGQRLEGLMICMERQTQKQAEFMIDSNKSVTLMIGGCVNAADMVAEWKEKYDDVRETGKLPESVKLTKAEQLLEAMESDVDCQTLWDDHGQVYLRNYQPLSVHLDRRQREQQQEEQRQLYVNARLRPWQKRVVELLSWQNDHQMLFISDPKGNTRKTFLAKYLRATEGAFYSTSRIARTCGTPTLS